MTKCPFGVKHCAGPDSTQCCNLCAARRGDYNQGTPEYVAIQNEKAAVDMVNHPPHYGQHPSGVECIRIAEHYNFNVGNAIKYLWRAGLKGGLLEDLQKAEWYIHREIERVQRNGILSDSSELDAGEGTGVPNASVTTPADVQRDVR